MSIFYDDYTSCLPKNKGTIFFVYYKLFADVFFAQSEIPTFTGTKITHLKQSFYLDLKIDIQKITNKRHDFRSRAFAYFLFQNVV